MSRMVVQSVTGPDGVCGERELYVRVRGNADVGGSAETAVLFRETGCLQIAPGTVVTTDCYMNLFDARVHAHPTGPALDVGVIFCREPDARRDVLSAVASRASKRTQPVADLFCLIHVHSLFLKNVYHNYNTYCLFVNSFCVFLGTTS